MKELLEYIIKALVDNQGEVSITEVKGERAVIYEVKVADEDKAKIIGKQGRTANAIRRIIEAIGRKQGRVVRVEILA
ncbi:MAG: KH domain-containing protein [candidate division WOR-3 bacterium]